MAVARHERHAARWRSRGPTPVTALPLSSTVPASGLRRPVSASTSSSWPLPATPAMPRISPARTSNVTPLTASWPRSSATRRSVDGQGRPAGMGFAAVDDQLDVAADHQRREVVLVGLGRDPRPDDLAAPDDRDPVGDLEDLVQLVADEDDRVALVGEALQDVEDLLRLLRRQDRRRLVEDEDPGLAVERLEDLDPLLPADRQRARSSPPDRSRSRTACRARRSGDGPPSGRGRSGWPSSPRRGGCCRRPTGPAPA